MAADRPALRLADIARAGFQDLTDARDELVPLAGRVGVPVDALLDAFALAADPDSALVRLRHFADLHPGAVERLDDTSLQRLCLLVGASPALGDFFARHPDRLGEILAEGGRVIGRDEAVAEIRAAIAAPPEEAAADQAALGVRSGDAGWNALRVRYRELLAELMLHDLLAGLSAPGGAVAQFDAVSESLSVLAGAAIEASLEVARATLASGGSGPAVSAGRLAAVRLAVVAMGKCGAEELNVVSDVDVVFVAESADDDVVDGEALTRIATRLASETMRGIHDPAVEPPLWQLDANLRPEGRNGALVRTLGSMLAYYERWAKAWEFQALLKARPLAGDLALGEEFVRRTRDLVWASSSREDFVGSVQRMRRRVTEHISADELEVQLKLGPGGLRDIEFSVQLLQLVHGQYDERLHLRGTIESLDALVSGGYIARSDGERLAADYRALRVLEHRLQLRELRRTALMPRDDEGLRILARASRLAETGEELRRTWERIKLEVRELHLKIFYAPLLSAVAALPEEEFVLGSDEARARLVSIGFRDPDGAMRHLAALSRGTSRRAKILRNIMPVLLQWLADGTDPDFGLLAFRRVTEANRESPWYLRLLRDGSEAAERLTRVLSTSRFTAELLESVPEAVAWLERDDSLRPIGISALLEEMRALASRRDGIEAAAKALRTVHRREVLRLAMGRVTGVIGEAEVSRGLDSAHTALLDGLLRALRFVEATGSDPASGIELALIGMGRYGGGELGFASDIDLVAVFRAPEGVPADRASRAATRLVSELRRLVSDPRFHVDLDFDLRPEGKNGPLVRSLDAYRAYYERWSVTWEAQALLRARAVAGDSALGADFIALADEIRYPAEFGEKDVREVRRIKARMEAERLPRGADPRRHLKLGPGGISDVEWLVQLLQLRHGARYADLRTVSTLAALDAAAEFELLDVEDAHHLSDSWRFASEVRSALKLWTGRASDSLPTDWNDLAGILGVLDLSDELTSELEERWFALSRRARAVVEREFFGYSEDDRFPLR
ncbi:bifunctional [glutamine synthetase] adenylyltransferase/[glutamine synthetase]-adenylyl-L-tyrosine phosphorylase [Leucobacter zeae]|nr:bifunctional [glutamine synthetase] adenylyltransferase/[glutamine synthetase]-adenylyl-L-tyrosine phosphorylase [Leucobacter zeae]